MSDIFQIVKYEGDNSTFIWKSPIEDFNTGTQLLVHESQEAILFMNGQALDLFPPGRHTLETQNIPLIRKLLNKPTNDQTPFHCEVYFINKIEQMAIKWGTDSKVDYLDPKDKFTLTIGASGEMSLRVEDSRKLLVKLIGTEKFLSQSGLTQMFRAFIMARVKPYLAQTMQNSEFGIFEVDSHMFEISTALHKQLVPVFAEYGIFLEHFFVTNIVKPDGEKIYESFKELHFRKYSDVENAKLRQQVAIIEQLTNSEKLVLESKAIAQKRAQEGYSYQHERVYDVAEKVAQNEGIGNFSSTGIGLGMIGGVAGGMGTVIAGITNDAFNQGVVNSDLSSPVAGFGVIPPAIDLKKETPDSASPGSYDNIIFKQKLERLKLMKESGDFSDTEIEEYKKKLLNNP